MFRAGLQDYMEATYPGGLDGFQRDIVDRSPDLIAVGATVTDHWRASIKPDYVYIGSAPNWGWYARASLGPAKIATLRTAAGFEPSDPLARGHSTLFPREQVGRHVHGGRLLKSVAARP